MFTSPTKEHAATNAQMPDAVVARWQDGDLQRTFRFLKESSRFRLRPSDVFVVSYPRSGTTLTLWMLHLLLGTRPASTQEPPPFAHLNVACPWWERDLARGIHTAASLDEVPSPRVFKSHLLPCWLPQGAKVVWVRRGFSEVFDSYLRLYRSHLGFDGSVNTFVEAYANGRLQYGCWADHCDAWLEASARGDEVLPLRFERLVSRTEDAYVSLARHVGQPLHTNELPALVELSRASYMKRFETAFDHATAPQGRARAKQGEFIMGTRNDKAVDRGLLQHLAGATSKANISQFLR